MINRVAALGLYTLAALSVLAYGGAWFFVFDLFSHFRAWYFLCAALLCAYALAFSRRTVLAGLLVLAINGYALVPAYWPVSVETASTMPFRLLQANVLTENKSAGRLLQFIEEQQPDVIALQEIDTDWAQRLDSLSKRYPYRKIVARSDNFGMALYSRWPLQSASVHYHTLVPSINALVEWHGRAVLVINAHLLPPMDPAAFASRNDDLNTIITEGHQPHPAIITGDFNCTRFSPVMINAVRNNDFHLASDGFGIIPSWPNFLPWPVLGIDHVLIDRHWRVLRIHRGPNFGSDHFPIVSDLQLIPQE